MSYTIPNEIDAFNANQAEPDKVDFDIITAGSLRTGVISGCALSVTGLDMIVTIASGRVCYQGKTAPVAGGNITIPAADAANPRFDLVMVDTAGAVVTPAPGDGKGTAAAEPVFPAVPASRIVLGTVYVPALDASIQANQLTDKRVMLFARPAARLRLGADQAYAAGSGYIIVNLNTLVFDNQAMADTINYRFTAPEDGVYYILARVFYRSSVGSQTVYAAVYVDGGKVADSIPFTAGVDSYGEVMTLHKLTSGQLVTLRVFGGNNGTIIAGDPWSFMAITKVADA